MILTIVAVSQNNCLDFDGTNDYIDCGTINLSGSAITLECWVYVDQFKGGTDISSIMGTETGGHSAFLRFGDGGWSDDKVQFVLEIGSQTKLNGNTALQEDTWYHIAGVYDGSSMKIYINGILDASKNQTGSFTSNSLFTIANNSGRYLNGTVDEARVWSDARSETEIRQNMYRELSDPGSETHLTAYYKLNSASGTTAIDSKASYNGTLTNMAGNEWQTSPAMFGPKNGLDFDGSNDWVSTSVTMPSVYTKEAWVYIASANNLSNNIISGGDSDGQHAFWIPQGYSYRLSAGHNGTWNIVQDPTAFPFGSWQHIALTYAANGTMTLYRNGVQVDQATGVAAFINGTAVRIASFNDQSNLLGGKLDEVRIWSDVRTEEEIRENMCKTLTGNEANLVAYFNFDNTSGTTLQDYSGNGNDGTLRNMDNSDWVSSSAFNTWLNTSSSSWSTTTNWSRSSVPGSSDNVGVYSYAGGTDATLSGSPTVNNMVLGSSSSMTLSSGLTVNGNLILESDQALNGQTVTLGSSAYVIEDAGRFTGSTGSLTTTRDLNNITSENVAGLGAEITTSANMGSTILTRNHAAASNPVSILREYLITPTTNTGLNATLIFHYDDDELNGQTEADLKLYKSSNGTNWSRQTSSSVNTADNTITLTGIDGFSYWTASDGDFEAPGNALDFDGSGDYVNCGNIGFGGTGATLEGWVYINSFLDGINTLFGREWDNASLLLRLGDGGGLSNHQIQFLINGSHSLASSTVLETDKWYHIAAVYDASAGMKIYINGVLDASNSNTGNLNTSTFDFYIASADGGTGRYFDGRMDEIRVWNDVRSESEIQDNMHNTLVGNESGLEAYYTFNSSSGTTLYDATSNANNGAINGNPTWVNSYAMVLAEDATDIAETSFTANWSCPAEASSSYDDGYTIQYSTTSDFSSGNATVTALSSETSKSITGLTAGTTYYYRVSGKRSGSGTLEYSNVKSLTTVQLEAPGNAMDFDGSNDYVRIPADASFVSNQFTVEFWLYYDGQPSDYNGIMDKGESNDWYFFTAPGTAGIFGYAGSQIWFTVEYNKWTHVAGLYNGSQLVVYVNGNQIGSEDKTYTPQQNEIFIGRRTGSGKYFNGKLDDIRIWSDARTEQEIQDNMCKTLFGNEDNLEVYYPISSSGSILYDVTSNANNGNISGASRVNSYAMVLAEDATDIAQTSFTANWDCPAEATSSYDDGYTIQYSTTSDFSSGNATVTALSSETSKSITGLTAGTTYYYRVSGKRSGSGTLEYSNVKSAETTASFSTVVTSNADDGGTGTLRYIMANCDDGVEITFNLTAGNEIIILNDLINITYPGKNYNINGDNSAGSGTQVTIQVAEPGITTHKLFTFNPGGDKSVTLSNMTLKGGDVSGSYGTYGSGGCFDFYNVNVGTLNNVTLSDSKAINGGAIFCSLGTNYVNMTNCTITNTIATESGGGVSLSPFNNISITSASFSNCTAAYSGGGLDIGRTATATSLTVNNCTATSYDGGGIYSTGDLTLTNSEISDNSAGQNGGGIAKQNGTLSITSTTISDNDANSKGGGLYIYQNYNNTVTINNSTLSNNSTTDGSGIYGYVEDDMGMGGAYTLDININSSTISGNFCTGNGAGIYASDDNSSSTNVTLNNCILAYNYNTSNYADLYASNNGNYSGAYSITGAYALSGSNNTNYTYSSGMGSSLFEDYTEISANSRYQPVIADNGGSTETVALASSSIAIGTGSTALSTDQRGFTRNSPPCIGSFEQNGINTWEGDESSSWSTAGNWSANTVPVTDIDINIPDVGKGAFPVIGPSESVSCHDLTISSGASLTIQSTSSGTGSLIINGDLSNSGTITSQCYLPGDAQAWHMVSSPAVVDISDNGWNPGDNDDFYAWLETSPGVWVNYKNSSESPTFAEVNGSDNFVKGKGYLVAYNSANPSKSFTGTLNTGDVPFPLVNSAKSRDWTYTSGWNLLGNPYSSSIDWNLALRSQFLDNYAYIYDPNKVGGAGFINVNGANPNAYIPPHQGFFVLAKQTSNGQNFTFTKTMQTHGDGSHGFKENTGDNSLEITLLSGHFYDKLQIYQNEQSDYQRDRYDALKMFSFDNKVPQVFSMSSDKIWLAVNSLPKVDEFSHIPIGVRIPQDGVYTFRLDNAPPELLNIPIYIEDIKTGSWHRIDNNTMSFNESAGDVDNRFVLHLGVVGIDETEYIKKPVQVYSHGKNITIVNNHKLTGDIVVLNILGRQVESFELQSSSNQTYVTNLPYGVYVVYVKTSAGQVYSEKVIVN